MRYLGRKLLRLVFVVAAVTTLTFLLVALLPGDVAYLVVGPTATPAPTLPPTAPLPTPDLSVGGDG